MAQVFLINPNLRLSPPVQQRHKFGYRSTVILPRSLEQDARTTVKSIHIYATNY
ncbi:MAG: hypothetical protein HC772_19775 [Leptolyngbyaceae cyanobacterium CRU_2_3]|nr:hypothetical protein [Leptolyngbyaceae cyanobacterium CRU_2_3]